MKRLLFILSFVATMLMFTSCGDDEPKIGFTSEELNLNYYLTGVYDGEIEEYGWDWKSESYDEHTGKLLREVNLSFSGLSEPLYLTNDNSETTTNPSVIDKIIGKVNVLTVNCVGLAEVIVEDYFYSFDFTTNQFSWYNNVGEVVDQNEHKTLKFEIIDNDSFKLDGLLFQKEKFKWGE